VSDQCKEDRQISASSLYVRGKAHRAHGRALVQHARRGVRGLNQVGKSGRSKRANGLPNSELALRRRKAWQIK
jgi:hypothetical protein